VGKSIPHFLVFAQSILTDLKGKLAVDCQDSTTIKSAKQAMRTSLSDSSKDASDAISVSDACTHIVQISAKINVYRLISMCNMCKCGVNNV